MAITRVVPDVAALPADALLTPRQVAGLSGFTPAALKKWRREKRGPVWALIEGKPRYRVDTVTRWLRGGGDANAA